MTAIAYRDGVLAADSGVWGNDRLAGTTAKVVRNRHGAIAAAAGTHGTCRLFRDWFERGGQGGFDPQDDDFSALMIDASGTVRRMDRHGRAWEAPRAAYHVDGCAEDVLAGALEHGATAEQAVEIACRIHAGCRGPVTVERLAATEGGAP